MLRKQLHITNATSLIAAIAPLRNERAWIKPDGGLWTSSYIDGSSDWVSWCRSEGFGTPDKQNWFILTPAATARVRVIDNLSDLTGLLDEYGKDKCHRTYKDRIPDFERLAQHYDALHLTEEGQWATRNTDPNLYGWDCESTVWFRWCFTAVESVAAQAMREEVEA